MMMVNKFGAALLDGFFPNHCALCGLRSHRSVPLCHQCERDLPRNHSCCYRCAIPLPPTANGGQPRTCGRCLHSPPPFARVLAPWIYDEHVAHLIYQWKFLGQRRLTRLLGSLWCQCVGSQPSVDLLVPVPLHWRRHWQRGFNQSELLCRYLHHHSAVLHNSQIVTSLVRRPRATTAQSGIGARQRASNLKGAFTVRRPCDNLRIAIVDDVMTTGATVTAMATTLTEAGASHVEVWCLARTPTPGS